MKVKSMISGYLLARNVMAYRNKRQKAYKKDNELCENYFRVNDISHDDRGEY